MQDVDGIHPCQVQPHQVNNEVNNTAWRDETRQLRHVGELGITM